MSSERMFTDTVSAIKWAERFVSCMHLKSQIGKLMTVSGNGEPMFDVALTISARLVECQPREAAATIQAIYGKHEEQRDESIGFIIGERLKANPAAKGKTAEQLHRLGLATLKAERGLKMWGDKYNISSMAAAVGIDARAFSRRMAWQELRMEATDTINQWHSMVMSEMGLFLDEKGWLDE